MTWILESKSKDDWITVAKFEEENKAKIARWEMEDRFEGSSEQIRGESKIFRIRIEIGGIPYPRGEFKK
jgi:hypothetical protein